MLKGWLAAAMVGTVLCFVGGCSDSKKDDPKQVEVGHYCNSDVECPGGFCLDGECSKHCTTDRDCARTDSVQRPCGLDSNGDHSCVLPCPWVHKYVCVDAVSTACSLAPESECDVCGCPDKTRCEPGLTACPS